MTGTNGGSSPETLRAIVRLISGGRTESFDELSPHQRQVLRSLLRPGRRTRRSHVEAARASLGPRLFTQAPKIDGLGPMLAALGNPEVRAAFDGVVARGCGRPADLLSRKIWLAYVGMTGTSTHMNDIHTELKRGVEVRRLVADLLEPGAGRDVPALPSYSAMLRGMFDAAPAVAEAATICNIDAFRAIREFVPSAGRVLLIDGTSAPAWCRQRSAEPGSKADRLLRKRTPEAGARAIQRGNSVDFWRGYYVVTVSDAATGLPLIWETRDASRAEAEALPDLLEALFDRWTDLRPEYLVADSAWGFDRWCELLEVNYGIHPVFHLRNAGRRPQTFNGGNARSKVRSFNAYGRPTCAVHGVPMDFDGCETPGRANLRPGQPSQPGAFRARFRCPEGGGHRVSLPMSTQWNRFTYLPHYAEGRPDLFALRAELLIQRGNRAESLHQRLKVGSRMATKGSDRLRLTDKTTFGALLALGFLTMTGLALAQLRGSDEGSMQLLAA